MDPDTLKSGCLGFLAILGVLMAILLACLIWGAHEEDKQARVHRPNVGMGYETDQRGPPSRTKREGRAPAP